jgi:MFS family permease
MPTTNTIRGIFALVLGLALVSQIALSVFAWNLFEQQLPPEMDRKAAAIGLSIQDKLLDAVDDGVPFDRLEGVDDYFRQMMAGNRDLAWLVLLHKDGSVADAAGLPPGLSHDLLRADANFEGRVGHRSARAQGTAYAITTVPLVRHGVRYGVLDVGVSQSFIDARVDEIRLDIAIVVIISLLVAFEVLLFIISASLQDPLSQIWTIFGAMAKGDFREIVSAGNPDLKSLAERINGIVAKVNDHATALWRQIDALRPRLPEARIDDLVGGLKRRFQFAEGGRAYVRRHPVVVQVRILTFLFMFAEMLSRPFLPVMVKGILPAWATGETADLLSGMPISAFMFVVALGMPVAGRWSDRIGRRATFMIGAAAMVIGLIGAAMPFSVYDFTLWRMVTAAGYATMFMACQGFVIDNTGDHDRARGISLFVGAIMVSEVCAPAIGGILADRVGYRPVFIVGAAVAIIAGILGQSILRRHERRRPSDQAQERLLNFAIGLKNLRFVTLLLFAAIPAKLLLTGFLFFLVPVVLTDFGATQAEIGRIVMAYGIPSLVLTPVFAAIVDRLRCHGFMVGLGGIVAGAGLLPVLFSADIGTVLIGVACLGIGQAMSISPQIALVGQVCEKEIAEHGHTPVLGLFRLVERIGAAAGSVVAAALVAALGPAEAMATLGALSVGCAVVFSVVFLVLGVKPEEPLDRLDTEPSPGAAE